MKRLAAAAMLALTFVQAAQAQDAAEMQPASEASRYLFSTLLMLASGAASMLLIAGLLAREAGLVQARSAGSSALRTIAVLALSALLMWLLGFNLIFRIEPGGFLGTLAIWSPDDSDPATAGLAAASRWFFVATGAAIAATIIAGALAERVRLWSFLIFAAAFMSAIFPVVASWDWGKGYLEEVWRFADFSGATIVHSCGGWAALAGAVIVGPRLNRYLSEGAPRSLPSNPVLVAMGGLLIWVGWFGFCGGALGSLGAVADAVALSRVVVNSTLAAAAGSLAAIALNSIIYKKVELQTAVNGAVGGLVAISAGPIDPALWQGVVIGAFSGVIVTLTGPLLDRFRIDDAAGVVPAHLVCGLWGTLIVPWANEEASYMGQLAGVVIIGAYALTMSILFWTVLRYTIGVRLPPERERSGVDLEELARLSGA